MGDKLTERQKFSNIEYELLNSIILTKHKFSTREIDTYEYDKRMKKAITAYDVEQKKLLDEERKNNLHIEKGQRIVIENKVKKIKALEKLLDEAIELSKMLVGCNTADNLNAVIGEFKDFLANIQAEKKG